MKGTSFSESEHPGQATTILTYRGIPQRWLLAVMAMLGVTMAFMMRICLGITLTQMVKPVENVAVKGLDYCPMAETEYTDDGNGTRTAVTSGYNNEHFDWDEETQGLVLSAFYYGYVITHVPGGLMAQKYGGKHVLGLGILSTAVLTLITPAVARLGSKQLIALRFAEGLGEGVTFPALCALLALWTPPGERGRLTTFVFAGVQLGNVLANSLSGYIIYYTSGGWPNVFYFFGFTSLVWFCVWCCTVYNDPHSHPFISVEERNYLCQTIGGTQRNCNLAPTPWKSILTSWPVWALIAAESGHGWGVYTVMTDLPKYMSDVLHFSVKQNGIYSSAPYIAQWITSISSSVLADWTLEKKYLDITTVRKVFAAIGNVGPALGVICASFVGCDGVATIIFFTLGMALMGFCYPSIRVNTLDLSPNYSATIMALVNGISCLPGVVSPYVAGILTTNRTVLEWRVVFWIMFGVMITSTVIYSLLGSGEQQIWDKNYIQIEDPETPKQLQNDSKLKETDFLLLQKT
ncbi:putative inorganic phosphate cotransporter [Adelges cooleyi]|uniref:putative inorganic phosphate cotransporter n=1 Tax=Adelges cooleyi TaxID=133065 RepID=UPI00217FA346|nr:putative inorganic phosphate cotransporter [Adelges cooleyi]